MFLKVVHSWLHPLGDDPYVRLCRLSVRSSIALSNSFMKLKLHIYIYEKLKSVLVKIPVGLMLG